MPLDLNDDGKPDWDLAEIQCVADGESVFTFDGESAFIPGGDHSSVAIVLAAGDSVECTYVNIELLTLAPQVLIGDLVWEDEDRDGIQDSDENGTGGITVNLRRTGKARATTIVATTQTDADGIYGFSIEPEDFGEYQLEFMIGGEWRFTIQDATDDSRDSDADAGGWTATFQVDGTEPVLHDLDAGYYVPAEDPPKELPSTGLGLDRLMVIGGMLLLYGVFALMLTRRREDH